MEKLVRDKIPEIIKKDGREASTSILSLDALKQELPNKLLEELEEFKAEPTTEELADMLEVLHSLASVYGLDMNTTEDVRKRKKEERGGFSKGIMLKLP